MQYLWCAACEDETAFEAPPCDDGHGADCLDRACVECGSAVVLGIVDLPSREVLVLEVAAA